MKRLGSLMMALLLLLTAVPALAQGDSAPTLEWLQAQVLADGGLSDGFSDASSVSATTEAIFAATAAGADPSTWGETTSPLSYLASNAASAEGTGTLSKLLLSAVATGQDPRTFGGTDLVERLQAQYDSASGLFQGVVTEHAYAMLALHAAGEAVPPEAVEALLGLQGEEGGWSFDGTGQSDTNTTAIAVQALVAGGEAAESEPISEALAFLESQQNEDGGFPYQAPSEYGTESDANSTAWVIQALLATGQSLSDWNNPNEFLASLQTPDGAFQWKSAVEGANFLATAQALPALEGATYVELPIVQASVAPVAEAATVAAPTAAVPTPAAPAPSTVPTAGGTQQWGWLVALGALFLLGGGALRRAA